MKKQKFSADYDRLKKIVLADNVNLSSTTTELMKSDLYNVLNCYFELSSDIKIAVLVNKDGTYGLEINTTATKTRTIKII